MRKIILCLCILISLAFVGCEETAEEKQAQQTKQLLKEVANQVGMPAIKNFQEKKLMKMILELRDREDLICYAYVVARNTGKLVFIGKCLGYGLPYSVQFTNPLKRDWSSGQGGVGYTPQVDPNGLYMPDSLSATWLMMIDAKGTARPVYIEPEIVVSPFKLH